VVVEPTAVVVEPTAVVVEPTAVVVEPTAVVVEPTAVVVEPTIVVSMLDKGWVVVLFKIDVDVERSVFFAREVVTGSLTSSEPLPPHDATAKTTIINKLVNRNITKEDRQHSNITQLYFRDTKRNVIGKRNGTLVPLKPANALKTVETL